MTKELTFAEHQIRAAKAGWKKLSKAERSAKARHAVEARWAKRQVTGKTKRKKEHKNELLLLAIDDLAILPHY